MRIHLDADMRSVYKRLAVPVDQRWILDLIPQKIYLSARDFDAFMEQLEHPAEPSEKLKQLFLRKGLNDRTDC